jgi:hypothetical protein
MKRSIRPIVNKTSQKLLFCQKSARTHTQTTKKSISISNHSFDANFER